MKKLTLALTLFFVLLSSSSHAQKIIDNPKHGLSKTPYLNLTRIELRDTATVLSFIIHYRPNNWISIPEKTFIKNPGQKDHLFITKTEGVPLNEKYWMPDSGQVACKLFFPPVSKDWETIDYGEANEGGSWAIYDIRLRPHKLASMVPDDFKGKWYNPENGDWKLAILDTMAIYKNRVWKYQDSDFSNEKGKVNLSTENKQIELFLEKDEDGKILIGEDPEDLRTYCNATVLSKLTIPEDTATYSEVSFQNDSAVFRGIIGGYTPRAGFKTFTIAVNNIITGEQDNHTISISEDGKFFMKTPFFYPHEIYVRSPFLNSAFYMEPGKELFALFEGSEVSFMGDIGRLNREFHKVLRLGRFDYRAMQENILDMTPEQYKQFYAEEKENALKEVEDYAKQHKLSAKVMQIKKTDIKYSHANALLSYEMRFQMAYRKKHKIPRTQRTIDVTIEQPSEDYYDFLTEDLVNNQEALISSNFHWLINRLKYNKLLRADSDIWTSTLALAKQLEEKGKPMREEEQALIQHLEKFMKSEAYKEVTEFNEKHHQQKNKFFNKYEDYIKELRKKNKKVTFLSLANHLKSKEVELTEEEHTLIETCSAFNKTEMYQKNQDFFDKYRGDLNKFNKKHSDLIGQFRARNRREARTKKMNDKLGIPPGLVTDLMNAQDICRPIVSQMTPAKKEDVETYKQEIASPFIANFIETANNQTIAKIEHNKTKTGYHINEVPKTEGDEIFDAMMAKFKGKVVYVDFWASWCGPCRSGIERIKPLKEELGDEDVVFVYITNQSTPLGTWKNMIPDIKGEHFRVSRDEWNYLREKFNISGIPHYTLVDKNGKVVKTKMGHLPNDALKKVLLDHSKMN